MSAVSFVSIIASGAGLLASFGGQAVAQQPPAGDNPPGDIVLLRQVPHQNALLVGEPGHPTRINPNSIVNGSVPSALGSGLFRLLSDTEADDVRATRTGQTGAHGEPSETPDSGNDGLTFFEAPAPQHDRGGFLGTVVTGAVGGSTRQLQDILSSALGRGK